VGVSGFSGAAGLRGALARPWVSPLGLEGGGGHRTPYSQPVWSGQTSGGVGGNPGHSSEGHVDASGIGTKGALVPYVPPGACSGQGRQVRCRTAR